MSIGGFAWHFSETSISSQPSERLRLDMLSYHINIAKFIIFLFEHLRNSIWKIERYLPIYSLLFSCISPTGRFGGIAVASGPSLKWGGRHFFQYRPTDPDRRQKVLHQNHHTVSGILSRCRKCGQCRNIRRYSYLVHLCVCSGSCCLRDHQRVVWQLRLF